MRDGLFKRGSIWWIRTCPLSGKAESTGKRDRTAARLERERRERVAADPNYVAKDEEGLNAWALKLLEQKRQHKSAATVDYYRKKLGHVVRIFGASSPLSSLRPERWDAYIVQRREEGAGDNTIGKELDAAGVLAKFAKRAGAFAGDPKLFKPTDFSPGYVPRERFLTPTELEALLAVLSPKRAAWVAANVALGGRISEVPRFSAADLDQGSWTVRVRGRKTKGADARIPVAPPFRQLLVDALPFLPLGPWANMVRDLERACLRASIAKVTSNDLRRTHGSWLAEAGVSDSTIGRVLRHASGKMAREVYGRARPEALGETIEAQFGVTKTRQPAANEVGSRSPKGKKVRVAQSVEQWIENPPLRLVDWAWAIANRDDLGWSGDPQRPRDSAKFRIVRNKDATLFEPSVGDLNTARRLLEATHLATDQSRPGKLRKASVARIQQILEVEARKLDGAVGSQ